MYVELAGLEIDRPRFAAFERFWRHRGEVVDGHPDAVAQVFERLLLVREARGRRAGEAAGGVLGGVARPLHLADERKHVGRKAGVDEHIRGNLLRFREGFRLVENSGENGKAAQEGRDGKGMHGKGHRLKTSWVAGQSAFAI
jgi:hypothetical protein